MILRDGFGARPLESSVRGSVWGALWGASQQFRRSAVHTPGSRRGTPPSVPTEFPAAPRYLPSTNSVFFCGSPSARHGRELDGERTGTDRELRPLRIDPEN